MNSGWLTDPEDPTRLRYWDGEQWTEHTSELVTPDPKPWLTGKTALVAAAGVLAVGAIMVALAPEEESAVARPVPSAVSDGAKVVPTPRPTSSISRGLGSADASADVVLDHTINDEDVFGGVKNVLIVTNNSAKPSNYHIETEALDANGVRIETSWVSVDDLGPGAKAEAVTWPYFDDRVTVGSTFRVTEVQRTSAN